MEDVGREVRRLREERGWSQAKLAAGADMAVSGISQIETGVRSPSAATLRKLARAFGVEVADLFPKVQAPLQLELEERSGAGEEQRLINTLAPAVIAAQKSWETYLEELPEQPTPEVLEKGRERVKELLTDAYAMYDALEAHGVWETLGPYLEAIEAGEPVAQPLRRNVIGLFNAYSSFVSYTDPKARNWASRFWERVESEDIDRVAQEWAGKERIPETDTAQKDA